MALLLLPALSKHTRTPHTTCRYKVWWAVDLGAAVRVDRVTIFNRADCCSGEGRVRAPDLLLVFCFFPRVDLSLASCSARPTPVVARHQTLQQTRHAHARPPPQQQQHSTLARLSYFEIRVGDAYPIDNNYPYNADGVAVNPLCAYYNGEAPGGGFDVACTTPRVGRYLSIQVVVPRFGIMTVCEVQVWGATRTA